LDLFQSGSERRLKFYNGSMVSGELMKKNIILSDKVWGRWLLLGSGDRSNSRSGGCRGVQGYNLGLGTRERRLQRKCARHNLLVQKYKRVIGRGGEDANRRQSERYHGSGWGIKEHTKVYHEQHNMT
jgi:hypothetical protein